jgi:uncharacterized membrane protein
LWIVRLARSRPRLFVSTACGIALGFLFPHDWRLITRLLLAWNAGTWLYFILSGLLVANASHETVRIRAEAQDEGRLTILILSILAGAAAIGAIVAQLGIAKNMAGFEKGLHLGLAAATVVSAWAFIHLIFALHYAHDFYAPRGAPGSGAGVGAGGLDFPGTDQPDYWDFLYFSYVIGVAAQTADVSITSAAMRRTSLVHCVLAFFFNSAVLALMINLAAGLI